MRKIAVALILTIVCACGRWKPDVTSNAPNGAWRLVVYTQAWGPDGSVRVSLEDVRGRGRATFSAKGDRSPLLTEVYWSPDGAKVGVLVCDGVNDDLLIAFDVQTGAEFRSASIEQALQRNLMLRYSPDTQALASYKGDVMAWACNDSEAYRQYVQHISTKKILPTLQLRY